MTQKTLVDNSKRTSQDTEVYKSLHLNVESYEDMEEGKVFGDSYLEELNEERRVAEEKKKKEEEERKKAFQETMQENTRKWQNAMEQTFEQIRKAPTANNDEEANA